MAVRKLEQQFPVFQPHDASARVGGRTGVDELHAIPRRVRQRVVSDPKAGGLVGIQVDRRGAGKYRCALVDLVERIRTDDLATTASRVDDCLREGEQGLARAVHGQHLGRRIERGQRIAPAQPARDRLAQGGGAGRRRIDSQPVERIGQCMADQRRSRMLGLADRKVDRPQGGIRGDALKQRPQPFEGVRLQRGQTRVHRRGSAPGKDSSDTEGAGRQPRLRCSATTVVNRPPRTLKRAVRRM